jgi:hypothetical protein
VTVFIAAISVFQYGWNAAVINQPRFAMVIETESESFVILLEPMP